MSSKVQFNQPRTAYDEEQAYQRHLAYLRTQGKNSQGFQDSLRNIKMGNMPTADAPQTADEILGDQNEINRRVQSILGKLFTDSREQYNPLGVETRDEFEKRARPSTYLLDGLPNDMKVLLVTEAPSILAELKNKKLLTADTFINYLDHYNVAFRESGGTSKYNTNNKLLGDITALINTLPQRDTIDGLTNLIARLGAQSVMARVFNQGQSAEMRGVVNDISNKLNILQKGLPTNEDLRQVAQSVSRGTMDILQNQNNIRRGVMSQASTYYNEAKADADRSQQTLSNEIGELDSSRQRDMARLDNNAMASTQVLDRLETLMQNVPTEATLTARLAELGGVLRTLLHLSDQTSLRSDISTSTVAIAQIKSVLLNLQEDLESVTKPNIVKIQELLESVKDDTDFMASNTEIATTKSFDVKLKAQRRKEAAALKIELGLKPSDLLSPSQKNEVDRRAMLVLTTTEATPVSSSSSMGSRFTAMAQQLNPFKEESDNKDNNNAAEKDSVGNGFNRKNMNPRYARVMGKGIALDSEPKKFYEFGKYMVSIPHLGNNILKVKYLINGNDVPSFKSVKVSDNMIDFIEDLVESGKMNERTLNKLEPAEKRLFGKLIKQSGLYEKYKIRTLKNPAEKAEEDRFELVKGEFIAGNDNPLLVKELKHLIIKFMTEDRIPKREGHELLFQLSI